MLHFWKWIGTTSGYTSVQRFDSSVFFQRICRATWKRTFLAGYKVVILDDGSGAVQYTGIVTWRQLSFVSASDRIFKYRTNIMQCLAAIKDVLIPIYKLRYTQRLKLYWRLRPWINGHYGQLKGDGQALMDVRAGPHYGRISKPVELSIVFV